MADATKRLQRIFTTLGSPYRGSFVRAVSLEFVAREPLSTIGSIAGGRYNPADALQALYLAETSDTAVREKRLVVDDPGGARTVPSPPTVILSVEVDLQIVVDLRDERTLAQLRVASDALLRDWLAIVKSGRVPLTQRLGAAAAAAGVEALLVPSKRHAGHVNLVVFPANLLIGSAVAIVEPRGLDPNAATRINGTRIRRTYGMT